MNRMYGPVTIAQRPEDLRILYLLLKLRADTAETDAEIVEALQYADWFNRIMLVVPSWQDKPDAVRHPLVLHALAICRERRMPVVWGRWLWRAWPEPDTPAPGLPNHIDPAYYARAIATVETEAISIGATGTFLDAEPYANSREMTTLKHVTLNLYKQAEIRSSVMTAVRRTGCVDFIRPTSSSRGSHFAWALTDLGNQRCDSKCYYSKGPDCRVPKVRPPEHCEHRIDVWGCNVGLDRPEDVQGEQVKLTAADVKEFDLSAIRKRYPECRGVWVYVDFDIFAEVVQGWGF